MPGSHLFEQNKHPGIQNGQIRYPTTSSQKTGTMEKDKGKLKINVNFILIMLNAKFLNLITEAICLPISIMLFTTAPQEHDNHYKY